MYEKMKAAQAFAESLGTVTTCEIIQGTQYGDPGYAFTGSTADGKKFRLEYHEESDDDS